MTRESCTNESLDDKNCAAENAYKYDDDGHTDVPSDSHHFPYTPEDPSDCHDIDNSTFSAVIVAVSDAMKLTLKPLEEECSSDAHVHEAYVEHKVPRDRNQVRRGCGFWPFCGPTHGPQPLACRWVERARWQVKRERQSQRQGGRSLSTAP